MDKEEMDRGDRIFGRIMLGFNILGYIVSVVLTAGATWTLLGFDSCKKTFVCDDDILAPSFLVAFGLTLAILCWTLTQLYRRNMADDAEREIRNPQPFVGWVAIVVGLGFLVLDVQQKLMHANSGLAFYEWLEAQSVWIFIFTVGVDIFLVGFGVVLLRRFYIRANGYPYL